MRGEAMKKLVMYLVFAVVLVMTMLYYDDPKYYNKLYKKTAKKNMKKFDCISDLLNL